MLILRAGGPNQLFQLTHIHHFRVTEHLVCIEPPFGDEEMIWHPIKRPRFYETRSKLRHQNEKLSLKISFCSYLKGRDDDWSIQQGVFYRVISAWKHCQIGKTKYKMLCVLIKRKSVRALELSESFDGYCWTQVHIRSQLLSLRECQL